ncbi:MAG: hypothetical protein FJW32_00770 [Acidobacteria bacterium]|nr:hypothetical protein [Acidobacteriota bacterium]
MRFLLMSTILLPLLAQHPPKPQFPQHSTGWPSMFPPPLENHATNLSRSISGRPIPSRPGAAPIYPVATWLPLPYQPIMQPAAPPVVIFNQQSAPAPAAPVLVVNPDYRQEVARPVMTEYGNVSKPFENFTPSAAKVFLLALKDGTLRQSVAFWIENDTLHFVQPDHKQASVKLDELDRESSIRFNKERGLDLRL